MRRWFVALVVLISCSIAGCSPNGLSGDKPPSVQIKVGSETFDTKLGSYCWSGGWGKTVCADTGGPVELLKGQEPIKVKPGETITFMMKYDPKPNKIHLEQIHNHKESEVPVKHNQMKAPEQKGVYYYSYGVWWMDKKEENVSNGDAFYAFVIEVI